MDREGAKTEKSRELYEWVQALVCSVLAVVAAFTFGIRLIAESIGEVIEIDVLKEIIDSLRTHLGNELVGVSVVKKLVFAGKTVHDVEILLLGEKVETLYGVLTVGSNTGIDDYITLVVDDGIKLL